MLCCAVLCCAVLCCVVLQRQHAESNASACRDRRQAPLVLRLLQGPPGRRYISVNSFRWTKCEGCMLKHPSFALPGEGKRRWCGDYATTVAGLARVPGGTSTKCEDCWLKYPSFGTAAEGKRRWCGSCSKGHGGVLRHTRQLGPQRQPHQPCQGLRRIQGQDDHDQKDRQDTKSAVQAGPEAQAAAAATAAADSVLRRRRSP